MTLWQVLMQFVHYKYAFNQFDRILVKILKAIWGQDIED